MVRLTAISSFIRFMVSCQSLISHKFVSYHHYAKSFHSLKHPSKNLNRFHHHLTVSNHYYYYWTNMFLLGAYSLFTFLLMITTAGALTSFSARPIFINFNKCEALSELTSWYPPLVKLL